MWALLEQAKLLMHCENTAFVYHSEFSMHIIVEGVVLIRKMFVIISVMLDSENSYKNRKIYLHDLFEKGN